MAACTGGWGFRSDSAQRLKTVELTGRGCRGAANRGSSASPTAAVIRGGRGNRRPAMAAFLRNYRGNTISPFHKENSRGSAAPQAGSRVADHPSAPMAGVSTPEMAAAVSSAGGLGSIGVGSVDAETTGRMIAEVRARTEHPFQVNVFCHQPAPAADAARGEPRGWRGSALNSARYAARSHRPG